MKEELTIERTTIHDFEKKNADLECPELEHQSPMFCLINSQCCIRFTHTVDGL